MAPTASSSSLTQDAVEYSIDHTRVTSPSILSSSGDLTHLEAEEAMRSCALQILEQPLEMLRNGILSDEELARPSSNGAGSTIGKHLRHGLDHFRLLLDPIEAAKGHGVPLIDYDRRARSVPIETNAKAALAEFEHTQERLQRVFTSHDGSTMGMQVKLSATTPITQEFTSTAGRELLHVSLHLIHHYALVRVIMNEFRIGGDSISKDFGVAPSTLVYRQWSKAHDQPPSPRAKL